MAVTFGRTNPEAAAGQRRYQQVPIEPDVAASSPSGPSSTNYVISSTTPSAPTEGLLWYNSSTDLLQIYESGGWVNIRTANPASGGNNYLISESDPTDAMDWTETQGILWFQPSTDIIKVRGGANEMGEGAEWRQVYPQVGGGPSQAGGDTFSATAGEAITVPSNSVKGVRWGSGLAWTVSTTVQAGDGGVDNISTAGTTTPVAKFSVHAEGANNLMALSDLGLHISNDNGATWSGGFMSSPDGVPARYFKVFGTRVFLLQSSGYVSTAGSNNFSGAQIRVGTIDWANRTITDDGMLNDPGGLGNCASFYYIPTAAKFYYTWGSSDDLYFYRCPLAVDSVSLGGVDAAPQIDSSLDVSTDGSPIYLDLVGTSGTHQFWRIGNRVFTMTSSLGVNATYSITTSNTYRDILVNPANSNQWILTRLDAQNEITLETATYTAPASGDNFGTLGSFSTAISDGPIPSEVGDAFLSAPNASRGLYVGLGHRYSITDSSNTWTISSSNPNTSAKTNLEATPETTPRHLADSVHANSPTQRIVLDRNRGLLITNDNGATWGTPQRPITAAYTGTPTNFSDRYRWFRVYGDEVFLVSSSAVVTGRTTYWNNATIYVGEIDYSAKTVSGWQALTADSGYLSSSNFNNMSGFVYDVTARIFWLGIYDSGRITVQRYTLNAGSHTATYVSQPISRASTSISTTNADFGQFNYLGHSTGGGATFRLGAAILGLNDTNSSFTHSGQLPGYNSDASLYLATMINPDNNKQLILIKYTPDSSQYSLELATINHNTTNVTLSNFTEILHLPTGETYDGPNTLSGTSAAGLWAGPEANYTVSTSDNPSKVYLKEQTDAGELVGFIKSTVAAEGTATVQYRGLLSGLSGLTAGSDYIYEGQDVGTAISATSVVLRTLPD